MLNSILYQVQNIKVYMIMFLCIASLILLILYQKIKKFNSSKSDITLYGLFINLNTKDLLKITVNIIKYTTIIYCTWGYHIEIMTYLIMIAITTIIYIVLQSRLKDLNIELVNMIMILIALYASHILGSYIADVETELSTQVIQILISTFITVYSIYFFFRTYDEIMQSHMLRIRRKQKWK